MLRASETEILPQSELDDMAAMLTPEQYAQVLQCLFFDAAILGSYFGKELARRGNGRPHHWRLPYDPAIPVHTAGHRHRRQHGHSAFFQIVRSELHVILDHYEASGSRARPLRPEY